MSDRSLPPMCTDDWDDTSSDFREVEAHYATSITHVLRHIHSVKEKKNFNSDLVTSSTLLSF